MESSDSVDTQDNELGQNRTFQVTQAGETIPQTQLWTWIQTQGSPMSQLPPNSLVTSDSRSRLAQVQRWIMENASNEPVPRKVILESLGTLMTQNTVDRHLIALAATPNVTKTYVGTQAMYQWTPPAIPQWQGAQA